MDTTQVEDELNEMRGRLGPQMEEAQRRLEELNQRATAFIKEHPGACLLGALAAGYLVARIARR